MLTLVFMEAFDFILESNSKSSVEYLRDLGVLIVAICALVVSFLMYRLYRKQIKALKKQIDDQNDYQERQLKNLEKQSINQHNAYVHSIKPCLTIIVSRLRKERTLTLVNYGAGVAVIKKFEFTKGDKSGPHILKIIDLEENNIKNFWRFGDWDYYLLPRDEYRLCNTSTAFLQSEVKMDETEANQLLEKWDEEMENLHIEIHYTDLMGNKMNPVIRDVIIQKK